MIFKSGKRLAMTLVELMVVMSIVILFAAITAAFYPANQADRELSRFSNSVQSALLSARNRARADRLPTGIRFYADSTNPNRVGNVITIQKPSAIEASQIGNAITSNLIENPPSSGIYQLMINFPPTYPISSVLHSGDFVVLDSGDVAKIDSFVAPSAMNPNPNATISNSGSYSTSFLQNNSSNPLKYKLYRGLDELSGDKPFELSDTIEIGMPISSVNFSSSTFVYPLPLLTYANVPSTYPFPPTSNNYFDIVFMPDGSLQNNLQSDIFLHLRNFESVAGTGPSFSNVDFSRDAILVVRRTTGATGVFEVGPIIDLSYPNRTDATKHNPYLFAKDPRNKGI